MAQVESNPEQGGVGGDFLKLTLLTVGCVLVSWLAMKCVEWFL